MLTLEISALPGSLLPLCSYFSVINITQSTMSDKLIVFFGSSFSLLRSNASYVTLVVWCTKFIWGGGEAVFLSPACTLNKLGHLKGSPIAS